MQQRIDEQRRDHDAAVAALEQAHASHLEKISFLMKAGMMDRLEAALCESEVSAAADESEEDVAL